MIGFRAFGLELGFRVRGYILFWGCRVVGF